MIPFEQCDHMPVNIEAQRVEIETPDGIEQVLGIAATCPKCGAVVHFKSFYDDPPANDSGFRIIEIGFTAKGVSQ